MSRISCSICYDFISSESVLLHLNCGHIYHANCLWPWIKTSKTCPDCRTRVIDRPTRVYPNFDVDDDDETLLLTDKIEILENKNQNLEEQLSQLHTTQHEVITAQLAKKTYEVMKVTNAMKSLEHLYFDANTKNEELTRTNEEVTERLNACQGQLNNVNGLLLSQQNESTNLTYKIMSVEKQLQFAESDALMDKYFRTVATTEKDEAIEQLNESQRQLFYAHNTIDRNCLQIETVLCELERMRTEKQLQEIRIRRMEQTICERDMGHREMEQENVQLKSKLKEIMSQQTVCSSVMPQKRKLTACCDIDNGIYTTETDQPPIKLMFRKMETDSSFACVPVL